MLKLRMKNINEANILNLFGSLSIAYTLYITYVRKHTDLRAVSFPPTCKRLQSLKFAIKPKNNDPVRRPGVFFNKVSGKYIMARTETGLVENCPACA